MNRLYLIFFFQLMAISAFCQTTPQSDLSSQFSSPEALVTRLYAEVVIHHPYGLLVGEEAKPFARYLSNALRHKNDLAFACLKDWGRQLLPASRDMKPPSQWEDIGLFSGGNERGEPTEYHIEKAQTQKDGSFVVYVKLTRTFPYERPMIWYIAAVVVREDDHLAVDDIIYLKDDEHKIETRMSEVISRGCNGARWVGGIKQ